MISDCEVYMSMAVREALFTVVPVRSVMESNEGFSRRVDGIIDKILLNKLGDGK